LKRHYTLQTKTHMLPLNHSKKVVISKMKN